MKQIYTRPWREVQLSSPKEKTLSNQRSMLSLVLSMQLCGGLGESEIFNWNHFAVLEQCGC